MQHIVPIHNNILVSMDTDCLYVGSEPYSGAAILYIMAISQKCYRQSIFLTPLILKPMSKVNFNACMYSCNYV